MFTHLAVMRVELTKYYEDLPRPGYDHHRITVFLRVEEASLRLGVGVSFLVKR
jgi:hypothetical protein